MIDSTWLIDKVEFAKTFDGRPLGTTLGKIPGRQLNSGYYPEENVSGRALAPSLGLTVIKCFLKTLVWLSSRRDDANTNQYEPEERLEFDFCDMLLSLRHTLLFEFGYEISWFG